MIAATPGALDAVGNLSASPGDSRVKLTWTPPQYGADRYEYRYKTTGDYGDWATASGGGDVPQRDRLRPDQRHALHVPGAGAERRQQRWHGDRGDCHAGRRQPTATEATPLTAAFDDAPSSHDGETAFTVRLALSEAVSNTADDIRDNTFTVSGGTLSAVRAVDGRSDLWELTIAPSGAANVGLILNPGGTCDTPGTLCTGDGRTLSGGLALSIAAAAAAAAAEPPAPLTARFDHVPAEHDGGTSFTLELVFSAAPQGMNNRAIRRALEVSSAAGPGTCAGWTRTWRTAVSWCSRTDRGR